jgi:hypothetical protein
MKTLPLIQFFSISEKLDFWTYSLLKPDDSIEVQGDKEGPCLDVARILTATIWTLKMEIACS